MIKGFLHAQSEFSFHNASNNALCQVFAARELINLGNHLAIRRPFVFQSLGFIIVDVMRFSNPVQPVDARIPRANRFFKWVPGPMY